MSKTKTNLKQILEMSEDLSFGIADSLDDLAMITRQHSIPECVENILRNALAKLAHANFTIGCIKGEINSALSELKKK